MQQKLELVSKAADKYADREAEAAAKAAPAPTLQIRKVEQGAAAKRLRQAAAPASEEKDTVCHIAAAAGADGVDRYADEMARAEA